MCGGGCPGLGQMGNPMGNPMGPSGPKPIGGIGSPIGGPVPPGGMMGCPPPGSGPTSSTPDAGAADAKEDAKGTRLGGLKDDTLLILVAYLGLEVRPIDGIHQMPELQ